LNSTNPCAIATKPVSQRRWIKDLLKLVDQHLNLSALFENKIYTLDKVGYRSKPNPDIFLYAAQQLGSHRRKAASSLKMRRMESMPQKVPECGALRSVQPMIQGNWKKRILWSSAYAEIDLDAVNEVGASIIQGRNRHSRHQRQRCAGSWR
jgi:beta-phosphoglucomutase